MSDLLASVASPAELGQLIGGCLSDVPGVERVLVSTGDHTTHIWSIVNNLSHDALYRVYACEDALLDRFPGLPLELHVVDRRDAPADNLIPGAITVFGK